MNVLSLCAGAGGLELGIGLALGLRGESCRGVAYVEREAAAACSLVASMEAGWLARAPIWSDLRTFDGNRWRGLVHILASGDPCQSNSVAGKRLGAADERFLAPEVVRIAGECQPDIVFRENVTGNAAGQLEAIVPGLEKLGYRVAAGIFSSAETGNTMRRERLFIMACASSSSSSRRQQVSGSASRDEGAHEGRSAQYGYEPASLGNELARPFGPVKARQSGPRQEGSGRALHQFGGSGGALGSPGGEGPFSGAQSGLYSGEESAGPRHAQFERRSRNMESTGERLSAPGAGLGGSPRDFGPCARPVVIPGPRDPRWLGVLERWPELRPAVSEAEAESLFRRKFDALAYRVERLRACGNGVDPVTAAYAFICLSNILRSVENSTYGVSAADLSEMREAA